MVGLKTRPFVRFTQRHCLLTQGSRLDTSGINNNNFEIHGKFQISLEDGRKFCPTIGNNGVNLVFYLFNHFFLWLFGKRNITVSSIPMKKTLQNSGVDLKR